MFGNPYNDKIASGAILPMLTNEEVMVFAPEFNSVRRDGKTLRDATGAFHVGAKQFCDYYGLDQSRVTHLIDNQNSKTIQARQLLGKMEKAKTRWPETGEFLYPQIYVFFCHGFVNGIQFGIRSPTPGRAFSTKDRGHWSRFIGAIARHPAPIVVLFACSIGDDPDDDPDSAPGSGDDSFGDLLRDDLCARTCIYNRVVTHTTARHSWYNNDLKIMDGMGSPIGGHGGLMLAQKGSKSYRALGQLLRAKPDQGGYGFAWRFPFMTIADIHRELAQKAGLI